MFFHYDQSSSWFDQKQERVIIVPTASISKGKGYARHNDRSIDNKSIEERSWDSELSDKNIIYINKSLKDEYEKVFCKSLKKYNQQQIDKGRPDRQIKNYYEKISRSKQEKTSYELIIQIGSMDDKENPYTYSRIQAALDEYNQSFQENNPNFHVFQQITHRDEKGMDHTHIMFFPVSTGNKRGLEIKNSLSGALKEMGYGRNGFDLWRESQLNSLKEVMKKHDLEFELGDGRTEHLNVRQYREYKKYESLTFEKQNTLSELHKNISNAKLDLDELNYQKNEIQAQIALKTAENDRLSIINQKLMDENHDLTEANHLMEQETLLFENRRIFKNFDEMDPKEKSQCFKSNKMTVIKSDGTEYTTDHHTASMLRDLKAGKIKMGAWLPEEMIPVPKSVIDELIQVRDRNIELSKETNLFVRTFEALKRNIERVKNKVKVHFER